MPTLCICTARIGNADKSFSENSGKPEKSAASIYGGWFRVLSGGSRWQSALPTGSMWQSALPTGSMCQSATPTYSSMQTSVGVWGSAKRSGASPSRGGNAAP